MNAATVERMQQGFLLVAGEEERIVDELVASLLAEIPEYRSLPLDELRADIAAGFRLGLAAVRERREPTPEELDLLAGHGASRARQGIPLEVMLQGCRVATRRAFELSTEYGRRLHLDPSIALEHLEFLWRWTDVVMVRAAAAHRAVAAEMARTGDQKRASLLRRLLSGELSPPELEAEATAYGLVPGAAYLPLRGRPGPEVDPGRLARAIQAGAPPAGRPPLVASIEGEVIGVVAAVPRLSLAATVAVGEPAELSAIEPSFRLAGRLLETATAFGMSGVVTLEELSLRLPVASEEALGELLARRYLAPLEELGDFGRTLQVTVREYLRLGMRLEDTARVLHIHPNSLRHRLRRYEELTGADLRQTESLLEVWWALRRRELAAAGPAR